MRLLDPAMRTECPNLRAIYGRYPVYSDLVYGNFFRAPDRASCRHGESRKRNFITLAAGMQQYFSVSYFYSFGTSICTSFVQISSVKSRRFGSAKDILKNQNSKHR